jgi:hypothetical protein
VITDKIKALILAILGVLLLLSVCVSVDYAANDTITVEQEQMNTSNCTLIGGVHYDDMIVNRSNKHIESYNVVVMKPTYPVISMWAKPSVRSSYSYRWYKKTFIDYCPHCHYYGVLLKNPKGVPEREYTCRHCGADYCAVTGKEKYSYSRVYLRRA